MKEEKQDSEMPLVLVEDLTNKQIEYIQKFLETGSTIKAREEAGISRQIVWKWRQNKSFSKQVRIIRNILLNDSIEDLSFLLSKCISAYDDGLDFDGRNDRAINIRVRTANSLLDRLTRIREMSELEERIADLEEEADRR